MFIVKTEIAYRTMKRIFNYIFVSAFTLAASSCLNEKDITPDGPVAETGDEVKFGLSLASPETKTVYGDETTNTDGKKVFPIYWTDGDKVQVFSPQCLDGKRSAEYKVILPDEGNAYYAKELVKTGETGIQWGSEATADFYSLYPSGSYKLSTDGKLAENIVIEYMQNIVVEGNTIKSDMESCLLYAKTVNAKKSEGVVNLHYDPISTVVMLTLKVAANELGTDADDFTIQSISLVAPEKTYIAGTFSLSIADGTFAGFSGSNSSNTVMAQIVNPSTNGLHTITNNEELTVPLFLAPANYTSVNGWKVQVVANGNVYTKTLNLNKALEPGQIHKITLPELKPATTEWDVSKWMTYIPRNVYLSEISIPGTWNSLNSDFQDNTSIDDQYDLGVRAYHLDTRWSTTQSKNTLGILGEGDVDKSKVYLATADGSGGFHIRKQNWNLLSDSYGQMMNPNTKSFETRLSEITANLKADEYMVVFCTFAQESYNGEKCPSTWYKAVSDACANNDRVFDASTLTQNTVVGDVLNHVIVVVNLDVTVENATLPSDSKCLFAYIPMELPSNHYASGTNHYYDLYDGEATTSGIKMYSSHAQISTTGSSSVNCDDRGYSHPLTSRDALVSEIWDWSKANYNSTNYNHDQWIYLGLGGYVLTSSSGSGNGYNTIEERYAKQIYTRISAMGEDNQPYYPLGIILMNNRYGSNYSNVNYGFKDICKSILTLNNKYRLQFDPSKPVDYNPNAKAASEYDASAPTGGSAF